MSYLRILALFILMPFLMAATFPSDTVRTKDWGAQILTDTDLEAQFDVIHTWLDAFADESSGHSHDSTSNEGQQIDLTDAVTGTLPLGNGGTGQTTLAGLLGLVYPVGVIYTNTTCTNPNTELGFGTWTAHGDGRVIVSKDSGDVDFDTADETGGSKTIDVSHTHGGFTGAAVGGASGGTVLVNTNVTEHRHAVSSAGSATQTVVQPYIVACRWERTA